MRICAGNGLKFDYLRETAKSAIPHPPHIIVASDGRAQDGRAQDGRVQDGRAQDGRALDSKTMDGRTRRVGHTPQIRMDYCPVPDRTVSSSMMPPSSNFLNNASHNSNHLQTF